MRILLLAAAWLLSGCSWVSAPLYTPADAVQPLAPGMYSVSGAPNAAPAVRVDLLDNGLTHIPGGRPGEESTLLGFVPLETTGNRFLVWLAADPVEPEPPELQLHFLAERSSNGDFLFYALDCEGRNAEIAAAAGAAIEVDGSRRFCRFEGRESLEAAMRNAVVDGDRLIGRLIRIHG